MNGMWVLNRGFIAEQVLCGEFAAYLDACGFSRLYRNFRCHVTNSHPFARMVLYEDSRASDLFPAVVVSTDTDDKPGELEGLTPHGQILDLDADGLSSLRESGFTASDEDWKELFRLAGKGEVFKGTVRRAARRDRISMEIWAENVQMKNELYEAARLFAAVYMKEIEGKYAGNNFNVFDSSVRGQRSNNWNFDFGLPLAGGQITFDADYTVDQAVVTAGSRMRKIEWEVKNYVKEKEAAGNRDGGGRCSGSGGKGGRQRSGGCGDQFHTLPAGAGTDGDGKGTA